MPYKPDRIFYQYIKNIRDAKFISKPGLKKRIETVSGAEFQIER
jgi:hypothetical protein